MDRIYPQTGKPSPTLLEQAETRTGQAEARAEQAETTPDRQVHMDTDLPGEVPTSRHPAVPADGTVDLRYPINRPGRETVDGSQPQGALIL